MHTEIPEVIALSSGDKPPGCDDPAQEGLAPSEAPGRGKKILVVDDSLAWLRLAREILPAGGWLSSPDMPGSSRGVVAA